MSDKFKDSKGSTLLIVIIVMTIAFMISSIVFGYAIRTIRIMREVGYMEAAEQVADTAITDGVIDLCSKIDNGLPIGSYQIQNNMPFSQEVGYRYLTSIYEYGMFDQAYFQPYTHVVQYKLQKESIGSVPTVYDPFAIESVGSYKSIEIKKRVIVQIESTVNDYFEVKIYPCK